MVVTWYFIFSLMADGASVVALARRVIVCNSLEGSSLGGQTFATCEELFVVINP